MAATIALSALILATAQTEPAAAQSSGESIERFDAKIELAHDSIVVTEQIKYNFGGNSRRGIYRYVPVRYPLPDGSKLVPAGESPGNFERVTPLEVISVRTSPGTPGATKVLHEGNFDVIRIGEEDTYITGTHDYEITYRVTGVYNASEAGDELNWNVTGDEWKVPIANVSATFTGPADFTRITCFAGARGSTAPCDSSNSSGATATFAQASLAPHQGLTAVVEEPPGTLDTTAIIDRVWSLDYAFSTTPLHVGAALVLLALAFGGIIALVLAFGRDKRRIESVNPLVDSQDGPVEADSAVTNAQMLGTREGPVEFRPPDDIRPGQLGVVIDEIAHPLDVSASIIDLAVRGYLKIEELPEEKENWFQKTPNWRFVKQNDDNSDLLPYEKKLFKGLFKSGNTVELVDLKQSFYKTLAKVQDALYADVVKNKWFPRSPEKTRARWQGIGWGVAIAGVGVTVLLAWLTSWALLGIPVILAGVFLLIAKRWMPHRTARGSALLARILGFRRYMETAETERMEFAEKKNVFETLLPYAIVFGLTEQWADRFKDLAADPTTGASPLGWYTGYYAFNAIYFAGAMNTFTTTANGVIVSTPPSSSGAGGSSGFSGGFSGGGFGGGGGGSW